jgi:copper(I)-binding protein
MTFLRTALLAGLLFLQPAVTASDAWVAEPASGATTAAAYVAVSNPTMYDIYIDSASSDAAGKIELREGTASAKTLTVPSYGSLEMKPGGSSLMLADLKHALKAGEKVNLTLQTDGGITLTASAEVRSPK